MTSPKTNLTLGHCAPVSVRPWSAPHPAFCHNRKTSFIGTIRARQRALRPNPSVNLTRYGRRCKPGLSQRYHRLSPGLQHLPPRAGYLER